MLRAMLRASAAQPVLRVLDQSGDALSTRRSAYLAATKVCGDALSTALLVLSRDQSGYALSTALVVSTALLVLSRDQSGYALSTALGVDAQNGHERRNMGAVMGSFVFERSQSRVVERVQSSAHS